MQRKSTSSSSSGHPAELDRRLRLKVEWARKLWSESRRVTDWLATIYILLHQHKYGSGTGRAECLAIRQRLNANDWSLHAQSMLGGVPTGQRRLPG